MTPNQKTNVEPLQAQHTAQGGGPKMSSKITTVWLAAEHEYVDPVSITLEAEPDFKKQRGHIVIGDAAFYVERVMAVVQRPQDKQHTRTIHLSGSVELDVPVWKFYVEKDAFGNNWAIWLNEEGDECVRVNTMFLIPTREATAIR